MNMNIIFIKHFSPDSVDARFFTEDARFSVTSGFLEIELYRNRKSKFFVFSKFSK